MADPPASETLVLLRSWHDGDRQALEQLLERDLPFVRDYVAARMGALLRARVEVDDIVHEAMIAALRYTPKFLVSEREHFRALLARITENVLRDNADRFQAQKRDARRERPTPSDSMLHLDPSLSMPTRPSQAASRNEERGWVRLAIDLLSPEDRQMILWHDYDDLSFDEIATQLGKKKDAVRMRFARLLPQLARKIEQLKAGRLAEALGDASTPPQDPDLRPDG
jgi:RNA polymerase sigma factor (sigma-70 family)